MPRKHSGSATAIVAKVRRLQKIKADRLAPPRIGGGYRSEEHAERARAREEAAAKAARGDSAPIFAEYYDKPVEFAREVLGLRLCRDQRRILEALARRIRRIAVRSGQKTGKSTVFVAAALWWAATRARARVLFTGPGNAQVRDVLWKELRRIAYDKNNLRADKRLVVDVLGVEPAIMPHTGMQWPDGREIVGFVRESPTATQGFSGPEVLIIIDEAAGVPDDIFEAHEGNTAAGGFIVAASQPNENVGWFFRAFHEDGPHWEPFHLKSTETPNCTGAEDPIPGLADPDFCEKMLVKYGEASAYYQIRILGEFAATSTNTVVGLKLVEEAAKRWAKNLDVVRSERLEIGVDVARFGDDETTIAPRRGPRIYPLIATNGADGNQIAGLIMEVVRELRLTPDERAVVKVDGTGGYGSSPIDILRISHSNEVDVVEINVSTKADDEKYANLRAQLHFAVAEWLQDDGELPANDKQLRADLLAPTYKFDLKRRFIVEPKAEIKKRLKRSPDRGDAVALAIYPVSIGPAKTLPDPDARWPDDARGYG